MVRDINMVGDAWTPAPFAQTMAGAPHAKFTKGGHPSPHPSEPARQWSGWMTGRALSSSIPCERIL